ncbi:hypothetical protein V6259_12645 [Marinomonas sp. TI.3.20]|uniref:hypothetical protein n=1 Tax=Marinomonas sp. TI.3.20 TaxID=3121296 RepID=UPI00311D4DED
MKINKNLEWFRSYNDKWTGIPSPLVQAELLKEVLGVNRKQIIGPILGGKIQQKDSVTIKFDIFIKKDPMYEWLTNGSNNPTGKIIKQNVGVQQGTSLII